MPVMLLSNTLSLSPVMLLSSGGSVPVSTFRLKSRKGWLAARVLGMGRLPSTPGMVPFRPSPFKSSCVKPPTMVA